MVRSRYGFDEAKIARFQKEGRGKGRGRDYLPWLKIGDVPSRGRSSRLKGNTTGRVHHFLSDIERDLFHLFDWDDSVEDVREQFPLDRDATRRIADALGIEHPLDRASRVPLVMTTDLLVDRLRDGRIQQLARAVKSSKDLDDRRVLEKLEIERQFWRERGVDWGIVTELDIPEISARNIDWIRGHGDITDLTQPHPGYFEDMAALVLRELPHHRVLTLRRFCSDMEARFAMEAGTALMLVRHLLSRKVIAVPMDLPLDKEVYLEHFRVVDAGGATLRSAGS